MNSPVVTLPQLDPEALEQGAKFADLLLGRLTYAQATCEFHKLLAARALHRVNHLPGERAVMAAELLGVSRKQIYQLKRSK